MRSPGVPGIPGDGIPSDPHGARAAQGERVEIGDVLNLAFQKVYRWHASGTDPSQTVTLGTFVPRGGKSHHLSAAQIALTQEASWTSPVTGLTYGSQWHISVPSEQLELSVTTRYPGAEIRPAGQAPYIEADSDVTGTHAGQATHGYGFAEQVFMPTQAP